MSKTKPREPAFYCAECLGKIVGRSIVRTLYVSECGPDALGELFVTEYCSTECADRDEEENDAWESAPFNRHNSYDYLD
jgi:hypothetical protein